jgi:hypothetical protein
MLDRLSRLGRTARERTSPAWTLAATRIKRGEEWLRPRTQGAFLTAGVAIVILLLVFSGVTAATAGAGAWFVLMRNYSEAEAGRKRRITESYSTAVRLLASEKLEERLGGIYSLEQISRESRDDYWTVMETLTAFVRERTHRTEKERNSTPLEQRVAERAYFLWENAGRPEGRSDEFRRQAVEEEKFGEPPATDIAAVLTVIKRRSEESRELETSKQWRFDLHKAALKQAGLVDAHLEGAILWDAHLQGAHLTGAHLEGADLRLATGLTDLSPPDAPGLETYGDENTRLPEGVTRPAHWPPEEPEETAAPAA